MDYIEDIEIHYINDGVPNYSDSEKEVEKFCNYFVALLEKQKIFRKIKYCSGIGIVVCKLKSWTRWKRLVRFCYSCRQGENYARIHTVEVYNPLVEPYLAKAFGLLRKKFPQITLPIFEKRYNDDEFYERESGVSLEIECEDLVVTGNIYEGRLVKRCF